MIMRKLPYVALLLVFSTTTSLFATIDFQEISLEEAQRQAQQEDKLFFLHFRAGWCMPCQWMEQNTFRDPTLSTFVRNTYLAVKVDIDRSENQELKERFGVSKLPTVLIFSTSGVLLKKVEEAMEAPDLLRLLRKYDKPANHRLAWTTQSVDDAMSSPKPQEAFSRPALVPDVEEPVSYGSAPTATPLVLGTPRAEQPLPQPTWSRTTTTPAPAYSATMAPRQVTRYGVQIMATSTYSDAVQEVQRLQERFDEVIDDYPKEIAGETIYLIVIGSFAEKSEARKLLAYLNKKDITGQIINIAGE